MITGTWNRSKKDGIFSVLDIETNERRTEVYKGGSKLTKGTVDKGMRSNERCTTGLQIVAFLIMFVSWPLVYYYHRKDLPSYIPLFMFGGIFCLVTFCWARGRDASSEYVDNKMSFGDACETVSQ